jgi:hypothetical protein
MKLLSLKLDDNIFEETESVISRIKKSRNRYINEAIDFYNKINKRKLISKKLAFESKLVSSESLNIISEFEKLQNEDQTI